MRQAKAYIKTITSEGAKKISWDRLLNACELYAGCISADDAEMGDVSMADVNWACYDHAEYEPVKLRHGVYGGIYRPNSVISD